MLLSFLSGDTFDVANDLEVASRCLRIRQRNVHGQVEMRSQSARPLDAMARSECGCIAAAKAFALV